MKLKCVFGIFMIALLLGSGGVSLVVAQSPQGSELKVLSSDQESLVLELTGGPDTGIELVCSQPVTQTTKTTIAELYAGSLNRFVGPFPQEAYQWHRLVPRGASALTDSCILDVPDEPSSVYLRVRQQNGQMAWASPVFINYAERAPA